MTTKNGKLYSVKRRPDGLSIKERYQQFRAAKAQAVREIEQHDRKMAASARRLLSVRRETDLALLPAHETPPAPEGWIKRTTKRISAIIKMQTARFTKEGGRK